VQVTALPGGGRSVAVRSSHTPAGIPYVPLDPADNGNGAGSPLRSWLGYNAHFSVALAHVGIALVHVTHASTSRPVLGNHADGHQNRSGHSQAAAAAAEAATRAGSAV